MLNVYRLFSNDHGHFMSKLRIPRTCNANWAVEDSCIAYKESVDTLSLDKRWDAECRVVHDVILTLLDSLSNPLLLNWVADVELTSTFLEVPLETRSIERISSGVDPVGDIALNQLRSFFLNCHARQQVCNSVVDRRRWILVCGIGCSLSAN